MNENTAGGIKGNDTMRFGRSGDESQQPSGSRNTNARRIIRISSADARTYRFDTSKNSSIGSKVGGNRDRSDSVQPVAKKPRGRSRAAKGRPLAVQESAESSKGSDERFSSDESNKEPAVRGGDEDKVVDQRTRATAIERERAVAMFRKIGQQFNENRKKSKSSAYEQYQHDLMENASELVMGGAITLKELTAICTDLETYMRDTTGDQSKTQADLLAEWLRVPVEEIEVLAKNKGAKK